MASEKSHRDPLLMFLGASALLGKAAAPYVRTVWELSKPIAEPAIDRVQTKVTHQVKRVEDFVSEMRAYYETTNGARAARAKSERAKSDRGD